MYDKYGLILKDAPILPDNPGIIYIPLAIITIVVVSFLVQRR